MAKMSYRELKEAKTALEVAAYKKYGGQYFRLMTKEELAEIERLDAQIGQREGQRGFDGWHLKRGY